jgi:hypothetical protein
MGLDSGELERLAEDHLAERIISMDLYCAGCGYNLRTRPYVGRCPECGGLYNARPLHMEGIFNAQLLVFPIGDVVGALLALGLAAAWIPAGIHSRDERLCLLGLILAVIGFFFARSAWRRAARFFHFRGIARRIESEWKE